MSAFESIESVQKSIELQKELLQTTDVSIKKITGRSPGEERRNTFETVPGYNKRFLTNAPPVSVYSRIDFRGTRGSKLPASDETDNGVKVSVPSSVVRVGEKRSRSDAIKEMKSFDKERGRRMFGVLQATLTQAKAESVAVSNQARREAIESRIEARAVEEKAAARKERVDLFRQRKEQQFQLSLLEQKMMLVREFEASKEEKLKMIGFICTTSKTDPVIFYRPKIDTVESEIRKNSTKDRINALIEERRHALEQVFTEVSTARRMRLGLPEQQPEHPRADGTDNDSPDRRVVKVTSKREAEDDDEEEEEEEGEILPQLENEPELMDDIGAVGDGRYVSCLSEE